MPNIVCVHPDIRIDLMVRQEYWPQLVSIIQKTGCSYYKEDWMTLKNKHSYVCIRDIKAKYGYSIGTLLAYLTSLSAIAAEEDPKNPKKFYILIKPRKKRSGKHGIENRKEIGSGSESGDSGEPSNNIQPEPDPGLSGSGDSAPVIDAGDFRELQNLENDIDGDHYSEQHLY